MLKVRWIQWPPQVFVLGTQRPCIDTGNAVWCTDSDVLLACCNSTREGRYWILLAISGSPDAEPNASTSFRGCTVPLKQACPERGPEWIQLWKWSTTSLQLATSSETPLLKERRYSGYTCFPWVPTSPYWCHNWHALIDVGSLGSSGVASGAIHRMAQHGTTALFQSTCPAWKLNSTRSFDIAWICLNQDSKLLHCSVSWTHTCSSKATLSTAYTEALLQETRCEGWIC